MLQKLDNKTVQGDGFRVFVPDIHTVVYSDGGRTARVEIEGGMTAGVVDWLVYGETLSGWYIGSRHEPMADDDKQMVLGRIAESLHLLEMPHTIV